MTLVLMSKLNGILPGTKIEPRDNDAQFDEKFILDYQKVWVIAPCLSLSRTAIIRTYLKEIVTKAHCNSVHFSSITKTGQVIFESAIIGHYSFRLL